jgi:hypothetical protein
MLRRGRVDAFSRWPLLRQPGPKQRAAAARISANNDKQAADAQGADGYESFGTG